MGPQVVKGEQLGKNLKLKLDILEFMIRSEKNVLISLDQGFLK